MMVPHWSHLTDLRQGIHTRQQRLKAMLYGCCELALLHQVVAGGSWSLPPLIYAITHQGFGDFFRQVGYRCEPAPAAIAHCYRPSIDRLLQRDDSHRKPVDSVFLASTPGDPGTLIKSRQRILSVVRRATTLLQKTE